MVARLAFVVIFENVITTLTALMRWLIPDVPQSLAQQMKQHQYLTNELIMQQEFKRAKELNSENFRFSLPTPTTTPFTQQLHPPNSRLSNRPSVTPKPPT